MEDQTDKERFKPSHITFQIAFTTFSICIGASLLSGYNRTVLYLSADDIKCFFNRTLLNASCRQSNVSTNPPSSLMDANSLFMAVKAVTIVCGTIGAIVAGFLADTFGRRHSLLTNCGVFLVGGLLSGVSVSVRSVVMFFVGRCVIGFGCGIVVGLASMYLTEIAPVEVRGAIGACHHVASTTGLLLGYLVTFRPLHADWWATAHFLTVCPALLGFFCLLLCPESPRYLFLRQQREQEAQKSLSSFHGHRSARSSLIMEDLLYERKIISCHGTPLLQLLSSQSIRPAVQICCALQVLQQMSGVNVLLDYSLDILRRAGLDLEQRSFAVIGLGSWNVLITLCSLPLLEIAGRRRLLLVSVGGVMINQLVLVVSFALRSAHFSVSQLANMVIACTAALFMSTFNIGLGPLPGLMVAELTRQDARAAVYSVSQAVQWLCSLAVVLVLPTLRSLPGAGVFVVCLVVVGVLSAYLFFHLPETQGRSFHDCATELEMQKKVITTWRKWMNKKDLPETRGQSFHDCATELELEKRVVSTWRAWTKKKVEQMRKP